MSSFADIFFKDLSFPYSYELGGFHEQIRSRYKIEDKGTDKAKLIFYVACPGVSKEELKVFLDSEKNQLSVSWKPNEKRLITPAGFSKTFYIPRGTTTEDISCRHQDGVLCVEIPLHRKCEEEKESIRLIEIS